MKLLKQTHKHNQQQEVVNSGQQPECCELNLGAGSLSIYFIFLIFLLLIIQNLILNEKWQKKILDWQDDARNVNED